jgi:LPS-assembly lipoprotein
MNLHPLSPRGRGVGGEGALQHTRRFALISTFAALSACGLRPLYGGGEGTPPAGAGAGGVTGDLAAIKIATIAERGGQVLRNALLDHLTPEGEPRQPLYHLVVTRAEAEQSPLRRLDEVAILQILRVSATWTLRDLSGATLTTGVSRAVARFDVTRSQPATEAARENARERAARDLAEDIRVKLALYFRQRRGL